MSRKQDPYNVFKSMSIFVSRKPSATEWLVKIPLKWVGKPAKMPVAAFMGSMEMFGKQNTNPLKVLFHVEVVQGIVKVSKNNWLTKWPELSCGLHRYIKQKVIS